MAGAALATEFLDQATSLFQGLEPQTGAGAIVSITTFLDRVDELESSKDRKAALQSSTRPALDVEGAPGKHGVMKRLFVGGRGAWAAAAGVVTVGGCLPLLELDNEYHAVGSGGGGAATSSSAGTTSGSGTGGETSSSTGTTSSSGTGGTSGVMVGDPCPKTGDLACAEGSNTSKLICGPDHKWASNGTCDAALVCDTTVDPGTCKPVVAECVGKSPGDVVCAGVVRVKCGPDLVTTADVETCPGGCVAGQCTACVPLTGKQCVGNQPQSCDVSGAWQNEAACSTQMPACIMGGCLASASCIGLPATCGPGGNESCCASSVVPGGTYNRRNDAAYPATVSDFRLDRFEITVGRFRQFVASYPGNKPVAGAGAHPLIAGSGWQAGWTASLAAGQAELKAAVKCAPASQTWTDAVGGNEDKPMNCLDWYEAFAFCAWDGGRLPTEAEWNYAAAGGSEQRQYPWSNPPSSTTIDSTYAVYGGAPLAGVGSKSAQGKGDGKWGQADLAGGVWEWNLDWFVTPYSMSPCSNCATVAQGAASARVDRGGSWDYPAAVALSTFRNDDAPSGRTYGLGARCARIP